MYIHTNIYIYIYIYARIRFYMQRLTVGKYEHEGVVAATLFQRLSHLPTMQWRRSTFTFVVTMQVSGLPQINSTETCKRMTLCYVERVNVTTTSQTKAPIYKLRTSNSNSI